MGCNSNLPNFGNGDCTFELSKTRRIAVVSLRKEDEALNSMTLTNAASLVYWQSRFNKHSFDSDKLTKIVPTCTIYEVVYEQGDSNAHDSDGYYRKWKDGDITFTAVLKDPHPLLVNAYKEFEGKELAFYFIDDSGKIVGKKIDTDFYPVPIIGFDVQNYMPPSEDISMPAIKFRIKNPKDMNRLHAVELTSGDSLSEADFYSLIDGTCVVTSPATTGGVFTLTDDRYGEAIEGLADGTSDYLYWKFYDNAAPSVAIPLASADKISESTTTPGQYTVNETGIFTTGHVYQLKLEAPGFDVDAATVTVP